MEEYSYNCNHPSSIILEASESVNFSKLNYIWLIFLGFCGMDGWMMMMVSKICGCVARFEKVIN